MKVKRFAESTRKENDRKKRREEQKSQPREKEWSGVESSRRPAFLIYPTPPRRAEGTSPPGSRDVQTRMNSTMMPHHLQTLRVTAPPACQQGLAWPGGVPVLYSNYPLDDALHGASATLPMLDPHRASLIALLASRFSHRARPSPYATLIALLSHRTRLASHRTLSHPIALHPDYPPTRIALYSSRAALYSRRTSIMLCLGRGHASPPLVVGPDTRGGGRRLDRDGMGWGAYVRLG
ncbi:hypothetical protein JHW43_008643 [Diplocarpon mali]|nr:hypothetical protein JHW43_008643 [Diplocarpon mali]